MRLIDSHAHLQADQFASDAPAMLAAARVAGVERVLVPGWDADSSRRAIELASVLDIDAGVGIHPHTASEATDAAWEFVSALVANSRAVAVGETGLDYDRAFSPRDVQLDNLRRHLALARESNKPVILHCRSKPGRRDAQDDLMREVADAGTLTGLLHSFSGPIDYAERAIELGLAISFSGLVFRRGEERSETVAQLVPADRLLIETDSPYLPPPGAPRARNEPAWVSVTAAWLATARGMSPAELGEQLVANYDRLFSRRSS